ncbi:MAG TPA: TonB-dependent receptor plug domain-containing protein [Opitutaceae bacterium]
MRIIVPLLVIAGIGSLAAQPVAPTNPAPDTPAATPPANAPTAVPVSPPAKAGSDSDAIMLSPFEVTSSQDNGYAAADTLAGSRIRTNLGDVAASLTVVDKEFLDDIGATDNNTMLQFTPNAQVTGTMGTYSGVGQGQSYSSQGAIVSPQTSNRVRGLASADNTRDFYITDIPADTFNIDRFDILRGPNAMLYGLGSPAGIVNATTNTAEFRNFGSDTVRVDSWGSVRESLDLNQQLLPGQLAIRIDGLWGDTEYQQKPAFNDTRRLYGSIRFDPAFLNKNPNFHTSLKVDLEHGAVSSDNPNLTPPSDSITAWWRPTAISASNPLGGLQMTPALNPYAVNMNTAAQEAQGPLYGVLQAGKVGVTNYQVLRGC